MASGVLSSSPTRPRRYDPFTDSSSSPGLPALSDLFSKEPKKPPLRSGSRAAPIPDNAVATFTTAGSVWRTAREDPIIIADSPSDPPKSRAKPMTRRKPAPKTVIELSPDTSASDLAPALPPEKTTAVDRLPNKEDSVKLSSPLGDRPWEKYKSPRKDNGQGVVVGRAITKPSRAKAPRKKQETVSKHFATSKLKKPLKEASESIEDDVLPLEPAMVRRRDWTPPPEDTAQQAQSDSSTLRELASSQDNAPQNQASKKVFKNLHGAYGLQFGEEIPRADPSVAQGGLDLKKRKAIEMLPTSDGKTAKEKSPVKPKAPKKKARTLTELALGAYAQPSEDGAAAMLPPPRPAVLLEQLPPDDGVVAVNPGLPATRLRKGFKQPAEKGKKKKMGPVRRNILLSPSSAMQQSTEQDFVFGTSSQLAREGSPNFLRDLHMAIKASNQADEGELAGPSDEATVSGLAKSKLWSAGARDVDGELVRLEVVNLVSSSPVFPKDPFAETVSNPTPTVTNSTSTQVIVSLDSSEAEVSTWSPLPKSRFFASQTTVVSKTILGEAASRPRPQIPTPSPVDDEGPEPPPSNQEVFQSSQAARGLGQAAPEVPRPRYELFTDAQLAREVTSYGFKAIKKRTTMIALLDQCWVSKTGGTLGSTVQTAGISGTAAASQPPGKQPSTATVPAKPSTTGRPRGRPRKDSATKDLVQAITEPPKRPRGRPRKDAAKVVSEQGSKVPAASMPPPLPPNRVVTTPKRKRSATPKAVEVDASDSEDLFSSPDLVLSSPAAVDLSINEDTEMSLTMSPTTQQSALFGQITKAVTSAPPSKDPLNPSWHEKMLMYDPIVLEDFAAWLNAGQLDRVGFDGEVSAFDAKKWCESKSVCCLWKVNLHGKERKRF